MVNGDGVSLTTTLAQSGTVAKTQARGQQSSPQVTPFSKQKEGQEELRIERVKETAAAEKNRITGQDDEKDKRKRRRLLRRLKKARRQGDDQGNGAQSGPEEARGGEQQDQATDRVGSLIDTRV
jgi:hypothetical protein